MDNSWKLCYLWRKYKIKCVKFWIALLPIEERISLNWRRKEGVGFLHVLAQVSQRGHLPGSISASLPLWLVIWLKLDTLHYRWKLHYIRPASLGCCNGSHLKQSRSDQEPVRVICVLVDQEVFVFLGLLLDRRLGCSAVVFLGNVWGEHLWIWWRWEFLLFSSHISVCGNIISCGDGLRVCSSVKISNWRRSFWTRQPTQVAKASTAGHDAELKSLTAYFDSWTECVRDFIAIVTQISVYQLLHGSALVYYVTGYISLKNHVFDYTAL